MEDDLAELREHIKCWERMFTSKNNRKPSKDDMKTPDIQKCYTDYLLLKKRIATSTNVENDVFGVDLNKPKQTFNVETTKFSPIVPNLRKKINNEKNESLLPTNNSSLEDLSQETLEMSTTNSSVLYKANPVPLKKVSGFTAASARYLSDHSSFRKIQNENDSSLFESETKSEDPKPIESLYETATNENRLTINSYLLNNATPVTKKRKLEQEAVSGGGTNEGNFVRLNMRNKKYRRPGKSMTGESYKRKQWKSRGLFGKGPPTDWKNPNKKLPPTWIANSKPGKCFKCGMEGHWATKCPGPTASSTEMTHEEQTARDELDFSCLEPIMRPSQIIVGERGGSTESCPPLLDGTEKEEDIEKMLQKGLNDLGYSSFRPGQREAVLRILHGKSTLLVLSTGGGKSLVYQLCAYLYHQYSNALTIVISPLISLMDDQIESLPVKLPGRCIHSHMKQKQRQQLQEDITAGRVPLLLLSPESVMGSSSGTLFRRIPRIAFVCIDEVHCMSSWSDNFRPAYLRVCDMLRTRNAVKTFLGLTATCSTANSLSVCKLLGVDEDEGVLKGRVLRDNLHLTVSMDIQKDGALISLLKGERFSQLGSIIIYCTRRQECERVAAFLRASLPPWAPAEEELCRNKKGKRKRKALDNSIAESYHAGLTPSQRSRVQYHFMAGTLRIVCATVAFGMGLDKANVRSVIHYSMPKSFENYVQEIGRAGRDGRIAHCHVFVDELGGDLSELSKHAHSNTVDRYSIQQLISRVFKPCACVALLKKSGTGAVKDGCVTEDFVASTFTTMGDGNNEDDDDSFDEVGILINMDERKLVVCPGHSVTFPVAELVNTLDVPEENIATMLTYLEMCPSRSWLKLRQPVNSTCHIQCYGGPAHLTALAQEAMTVLAAVRFYADSERPANELQFPYIELAARMGWDPYIVRQELRDLDRRVIPGFKSSVLIEFKDLSFHVHAPGNLTDGEVDEVTEYLYGRVVAQKNAELRRLRELHSALLSVATSSHYEAACEVDRGRDHNLKEKIVAYFSQRPEEMESDWLWTEPHLPPAHILALVERDIRSFINKYSDIPLTGRVIARIMQGIPSPNYPACSWGRVREYWRKHLDVDFDWMVRCASNEIARFRLGDCS